MARDLASVGELGLPREVLLLLDQLGVRSLYPPQVKAIEAGVLDGANVVVTSPTASGKTLIALMAAARHIYNELGKVVYIVPLKALANEKLAELKVLKHVAQREVRIGISTGDYDTSGAELARYDVLVVTYEKMDSILRHGPSWLGRVSLVVADEIHYVAFPERGPIVEMLLTLLRRSLPRAQFVGLSATVTNRDEIARWLGAKVVHSEWRPVPLKEGVYAAGKVEFADGSKISVPAVTYDDAVNLALQTVSEGGQAIVFVRTRREAVTMAKRLADAILKNGLLRQVERRSLSSLAKKVTETGEVTRLSEELSKCIEGGAAFHHAGVAAPHRALIEASFRSGLLKAIAATPTLAAGVNLPARRVIVNYYRRYSAALLSQVELSVFEYKQMVGRAGRPQYDAYGEGILVARSVDEARLLLESYVNGEPEKLQSKLDNLYLVESFVLALIASRKVRDEASLEDVFASTLFSVQRPMNVVMARVRSSLRFLAKNNFVESRDGRLFPTPIGKRVSELYILPRTAVRMLEGLRTIPANAHQLQYLYLIATTHDMSPVSASRKDRRKLLEVLPETVGEELVDAYVDEILIDDEIAAAAKTAYVLNMWIEEEPEAKILDEWGVEPGDLHSLAYTAEWLLYSLSQLAKLTGFKEHERMARILTERMKHGVKEELLELTALEGVGRQRARSLFDHGFKTIADLKRASISELVAVPKIGFALASKIKKQVGGAS